MRRMQIVSRGACAGATLLLMVVLPAVSAELQPGLWEISSKRERNGVAAAEQSKTLCVSAQQSKLLAEASPRREGPKAGCEVVNAHNARDGLSVHMRCAGAAAVDSTSSYVFDSPRHFKGVTNSTVTMGRKVVTNTLTIEGRLIGECPK